VPSTVVIGVGFGVFTDADLLIFSDSIGGHDNESIVGIGIFCKDKVAKTNVSYKKKVHKRHV